MTERRPNRIYFDAGVAHTVVLKFPTGLPTSFGNILYTTTEGKQFFVPADVSHKIQALGLAELEPVRIMKRDNDNWFVGRVKDGEPAKGLATQDRLPAIATSSAEEKAIPSQTQDTSLSKRMAACYVSAIDALKIAEEYAGTKGIAFRADAAVIHTCAHAIFIEAGRVVERQNRFAHQNHPNGGAAWRQ